MPSSDSKPLSARPLLMLALAAGTCLALLLITFGLYVFSVAQRTPNIAVDYIDKLNQRAAAVPEGDRAWPIVQEATKLLAEPDGREQSRQLAE
ncbi:MAG: hypothetical protein AAF235_09920, partial [Planctomycetota bacterium]